jgi:phosphoadenosine phosphosulfate reductase
MRNVMIKKRLLDGSPCPKCLQAEQMLRTRGLWDKIDEVVWAVEGDPDSPGMRLAAQHGVELAPFFISSSAPGEERVYTSTVQFMKELGQGPAQPAASNAVVEPRAEDAAALTAAADTLASRGPADILRWGLERYGADLAIAFSGAEDVVLIDMAAKTGLPFSVFCLDTGRLHPETYRFIDKVRTHYGIEISLMAPDTSALENLVRKKGLFSFYDDGHGECCGIRKVEPLGRALALYRAWATGLRRDQSPATRTTIPVLELDKTNQGRGGALVKVNPLANTTSAQVWTYIRDNDVPHNELHGRGFVSIGCEPCTRAILPGEHERAGRWWWEDATRRECGLHVGKTQDQSRDQQNVQKM